MTTLIVIGLFTAAMACTAWAVHVAKEDQFPPSTNELMKRALDKWRER